MKVRVYHGEKHEDFTVTELELDLGWTLRMFTDAMKNDGGFSPSDDFFVPWHKINYIEGVK
jgi:hypothetical protein